MRVPSLLLAALTALGAGVVAVPAHAASCDYWGSIDYGRDYAFVREIRDCSVMSVRHRYDPAWSSHNYWTNWRSTSSNFVKSTPTAEIYMMESSGY